MDSLWKEHSFRFIYYINIKWVHYERPKFSNSLQGLLVDLVFCWWLEVLFQYLVFVLCFFFKSLTKLCYFFSSIISSLRPDFDHEELTVPEITHIQLSPKISTNHVTRSRQRLRELSLNQQFPCRVPGYELQILDQPEDQHRARYLTEGSRGAVKNKAGDGHAVVKVHNSCNIGQQNC